MLDGDRCQPHRVRRTHAANIIDVSSDDDNNKDGDFPLEPAEPQHLTALTVESSMPMVSSYKCSSGSLKNEWNKTRF